MRSWKLSEVIEVCDGRLLCGSAEGEISHLSIDSRDVCEGTLFVPFVGERTDAHRFIAAVAKAGARAAFTAAGRAIPEGLPEDFALIEVEDTLRALQALGAAARDRLSIPIIAVTGSVGKTTTREMIAAALSAERRVFRTAANHNGQIGVPLTLLEIDERCELAVIEMGMSIPGEMAVISRLARPSMAVFTNIGLAHIEQLKTQENIRAEKLHIQDGMPEGASLLLNGDDLLLRTAELRPGFRKELYGTGADLRYRAEDVTLQNGCASFTAVIDGKRVPVQLKLYGRHQLLNALAALAVADRFGVSLDAAAKKLGEFTGYRHRQQIFVHGGVTVVDDSYNASPDSMRAALDILGGLSVSGRRIAVLADMKELGEREAALHRELGRYLSVGKKADLLLTLGPLAEQIAEVAERDGVEVQCYQDRSALETALHSLLRPGDALLFKGSNSMGLSALADSFSGNADR